MVSTVIHISFGLLIACALLPMREFSVKSLTLVALAVALVDSDSFAFVFHEGLHRALFHNILIPTLIIIPILYDVVLRDTGVLETHYRKQYILIITSVSYIAVIVAGIGLDLVDSGVNLFWPLHDQFYTMKGQLVISTEEGLIQTFTDTFFEKSDSNTVKTTNNYVYNTPVHKGDASEPRIFNIAYKGWQIIMLLTAVLTVTIKTIYKKKLS